MPVAPGTKAISQPATSALDLPLTRAVRAGHWVFLSGLLPDRFGDPARPRSGEAPWLTQANAIWSSAATLLRDSGSDFSRVVRCDQFFADWRAVPFFHQARRAACGAYIAPSTSILQPDMLIPDAVVTTDMIAVAEGGPPIEPVFPEGLDIPSTSSFVPVVKAGNLVFVAGFLAASGPGDLDGVAKAAKVPDGHLWKGNRIQLETAYLIREKLVPALAGVGLALKDVAKASVFLRDIDDVPAFNQVWAEAFAGAPPATTIAPTSNPGFAIADSRIEINLVAGLGAASPSRLADSDAVPAVCDGHPLAVRAGDLLLFSGMCAADRNGLIGPARIASARRHLASSVEAQMEYLIDLAQAACERAGTSLRNVVRIGQIHTNLAEFLPAVRVWQRRLPDLPLPISAVGVPGPLIVPGCTVQLDLWVYAP